MGLAEGGKKRSDRLHVIAPFSRDSRGSRLAPTSFYLIIWYPGLTSGLCVNPRKSTAPSPALLSQIILKVKKIIRPFPAAGGVEAGSIHYGESVQPRYASVSLKTWSGHGRRPWLFCTFQKESSSARPGEGEHITLKIQGTEYAYAANPDGTVADKKIAEKEKKKLHSHL